MCSLGFTGEHCEVAHCPRGDDSETTGQKARAIQLLVTQSNVAKKGMLVLSFLNDSVALPAPPGLTSATCKRAVDSLRGVNRALCVQQSPLSYEIRFLDWSPEPFDATVPHLGDPPIASFSCDGSAAGVRCELRDVVAGPVVREHIECSNHGVCNRNTGACSCAAGWYGIACELHHDSADVKTLEARGPFFTGAVLRLHTHRQADTGFIFLEARAGDGDRLFAVNGVGLLDVRSAKVHDSLEVSGSSSFRPEGLDVTGTVTTTRIHVHEQLFVGGSHAQGGDIVRISPTINAKSNPRRNRERVANPPEGLSISVDGTVAVGSSLIATDVDLSGDLEVSGHLAARHGLEVAGGATVHGPLASASLKVGRAHMSSCDTEQVGCSDGCEATSSCSGEAVLEVDLPHTLQESPQSSTAPMLVVRLGDIVRVSTSETKLQHRLAVETGGVRVASGGLEVSGGFVVHGGVDVRSGALAVHGGLKLEDGGMRVASTETGESVLTAQASHAHFGGTVLELLHSPQQLTADKPTLSSQTHQSSFRFLEARNVSGVPVASIEDDGLIVATGLHVRRSPAYLEAGLHLAGPTNMYPTHLVAGDDELLIGSNATYIELQDDGKVGSRNQFQFHGGDAQEDGGSRLLLIANADDDPGLLPNGCAVPGKSLALFLRTSVFGWQSVMGKTINEANAPTLDTKTPGLHSANRRFPCPELKSKSKHQSKHAEDSCNAFKPESSTLTTVGGITYSDGRQHLRTHLELHFDGERLTVPRLRVTSGSIDGPLDLNGHILRNARVEAAPLVQADVVTAKAVRLVNDAYSKTGGALPASTPSHNPLALIGTAGELGHHPALLFDRGTERLITPRLSGHTVDGHVLFENGAELRGASIRGGIADIDAITVRKLRFLPLRTTQTTAGYDQHNEETSVAAGAQNDTSVVTTKLDEASESIAYSSRHHEYGMGLALLDEDGYLVPATSMLSSFAEGESLPIKWSNKQNAPSIPRIVARQVQTSNSTERSVLLAADSVRTRVNSGYPLMQASN